MHIPGQRPQYNDARAPDYRVVYVSDIFGGHQIDYFEVTVRTISINAMDSERTGEPVLDRVEQVCLKMSPQEAKVMRDWLSLQIDLHERSFGKIAQRRTEGVAERKDGEEEWSPGPSEGGPAKEPEERPTEPGPMFA